MAKNAALPEMTEGKRLTNTSIRKRLCQKLLTANVPDTHAIHITGHKNSDSLNHYRSLTNLQQRNISNILSNTAQIPQTLTHTGQNTHHHTGQNNPAYPYNQIGQNNPECPHNQIGQNNQAYPHTQTGQSNQAYLHNQTGQNNQAYLHNQTDQNNQAYSHNQTDQNNQAYSHHETGQNQQQLSLHSQTHSHNSSKSSEARVISGLFRNATINGGTFNITIVGQKRKRQENTDSDEDCLFGSQDY